MILLIKSFCIPRIHTSESISVNRLVKNVQKTQRLSQNTPMTFRICTKVLEITTQQRKGKPYRWCHQRCFVRKVFLEISQNHLCQSLFFNKVKTLLFIRFILPCTKGCKTTHHALLYNEDSTQTGIQKTAINHSSDINVDEFKTLYTAEKVLPTHIID